MRINFGLYNHFRWLQIFIPNKTIFSKHFFTRSIPKLIGSFEINDVKQYLLIFMFLAGLLNATAYKTELIFTVVGNDKLFWFLTLSYDRFWVDSVDWLNKDLNRCCSIACNYMHG